MNQSSWFKGDFERWNNATWLVIGDDTTGNRRLSIATCASNCTASSSWQIAYLPVASDVQVDDLSLTTTKNGLTITTSKGGGKPYFLSCASNCTSEASWMGYTPRNAYPAVSSDRPTSYLAPIRVGVE